MKRLLVISPHFPPVNSADLHRVRTSLPYFHELGWEVEIVTVKDKYVDIVKDPLLIESVPKYILIHKINALSKKWTSKFGLGSLALRSFLYYKHKVNHLLSHNRFDLIYFSTTEFPICVLGAYWKKKYGVPYVIDMQDPWHTAYYKNKPKKERPKKYWFSYRLHKYLEPIAMKQVSGITSVSQKYIDVLKERYPNLNAIPCQVITFGAHPVDFELANKNLAALKLMFETTPSVINLIYVGRGGHDMKNAVEILLTCLKMGLSTDSSLFETVQFHFIGTSYAPSGAGIQTIYPLAQQLGVSSHVKEYTDRIGFYETIKNLQSADGLFIIGSNESAYTASKLYPYILAEKPLLGVFHPQSSASTIISTCNAGQLISLDMPIGEAYKTFKRYLEQVIANEKPKINWEKFLPYTSAELTKKQVHLFNLAITTN